VKRQDFLATGLLQNGLKDTDHSGEICLSDPRHDGRVDISVAVNEPVARCYHPAPRQFRMLLTKLFGDAIARLADDLKEPDDRQQTHAILFQLRRCPVADVAYRLARRFEHVREAGTVVRLHRGPAPR